MVTGNLNNVSPTALSYRSVWWALNSHVHTVVSSQFLSTKSVQCSRVEVATPDDDFLELDIIKADSGKPVVALFHGLEGSTERFYIRNLMFELQKAGFSCVAMNFRGCGLRLNRQKRFYHSGETSDYKTLFDWIAAEFPGTPIYAAGFSLGGNALIKSLGELGSNHPISKAVAISPPYDLKLGSYNLQKGFNRIYEYRFMRTLKKKLEQKKEFFPELPYFDGTTIFDFDDQVTAPVHGFEDALDYYESCSSKKFLGDVKKPLLLIHSQADTLTPLRFAPFKIIKENRHIEPIFTKSGGHVGFITEPRNWLEKTIVSWLNE